MLPLAVPSLSEILRVPSTPVGINPSTFLMYVLPPLLSYLVGAVLALTPRTRILRFALVPVLVVLACRAVMSVDMALNNPGLTFLNLDFLISAVCMIARALHWAFANEPLVRHIRPAGATPSTIMDAVDLAFNFRGFGWNWARGLHIPRETRPSGRVAFVAYAIFVAVTHAVISDIFQTAVRSFSPTGIGSLSGGSIFDDTLPFFKRYTRASIISIAAATSIYTSLQMGYHLCIIPAILIFRQDPAQWPPAFDEPWRATSLSDFWGRRWHQWFRHTFLVLGAYPLSFVFGRTGYILGAFLASAVFHNLTLTVFGGHVESWRKLLAYGMMALGVLAERAFYKLTGKKVGGLVGWIWTAVWFILWGNLMVDAWARAAMFGIPSPAEGETTVRTLVKSLVTDFDAWLHAI